MKPSRHPQLGRVVGRVQRALNDLDNDPMNDYAGFTPDPMPFIEEIVREEGFANVEHFAAVVEQRTSPRWTHFNLGSL